MHYRRWLSAKLLKRLLHDADLGFVARDFRNWVGGDPNAIDLQLRDGNRLMFYYGKRCVVTLRIDKAGQEVEAHLPNFIPMPTPFSGNRMQRLWIDLPILLKYAAKWCDKNRTKTYATRKSRGYHVNQLIGEYAGRWTSSDPWLLLDRVGIVQAKSDADAVSIGTVRHKYVGLLETFTGPRRSLFDGSMKPPCVSDTCDLLGVSQRGELLTINVSKGETASKRLAATLVHTACSRDVFAENLASVKGDLKKLWKQKVELGLLPRQTVELSDKAFRGVRGMLFIMNQTNDAGTQVAELQNLMNAHPLLRMPVVLWRNRGDFTVIEALEPNELN